MTTERKLSIIERWLNVSRNDAEMILDGVYQINGDYYSAFEKDEKLSICKNGFAIHRIGTI